MTNHVDNDAEFDNDDDGKIQDMFNNVITVDSFSLHFYQFILFDVDFDNDVGGSIQDMLNNAITVGSFSLHFQQLILKTVKFFKNELFE